MENVSSEEELLELRNEGKVTEAEYQELLDTMRKSSPSDSQGPAIVLRKRFWWVGLAAIITAAAILLLMVTLMAKRRTIDLVIAKNSFEIRPYSEGGLHSVVFSIRNEGNTASREFRLYFYRDDPDQLNPMDHGAGPIEPGDVWNAMSGPFALKEGVNEIVVVLDPHDAVKESDETNNRASLRVVVSEGQIVETEADSVGQE